MKTMIAFLFLTVIGCASSGARPVTSPKTVKTSTGVSAPRTFKAGGSALSDVDREIWISATGRVVSANRSVEQLTIQVARDQAMRATAVALQALGSAAQAALRTSLITKYSLPDSVVIDPATGNISVP